MAVHRTPAEMLRRSRRVSNFVFLCYVVLFMLFSAVAFLLRVMAEGVPDFLVEKIEAALSTEAISVEMENVSFSLARGLTVGVVSLYPKGVVSTPAVQMRGVSSRFRLVSLKGGRSVIKDVKLKSLTVSKSALSALNAARDKVPVEFGQEYLRDRNVFPELDTFQAECGTADIFGSIFHDIRVNVSFSGNRIFFEKMRVYGGSKNKVEQFVFGEFGIEANPLRMTGDFLGVLDPVEVLPILSEMGISSLVRELNYFQFPASGPHIGITVDYFPSKGLRELNASVESGHMVYNGVNFMSFSGNVRVFGTNGWDHLEVTNICAARPEGKLTGDLGSDLNEDWFEINARSDIDPILLLQVARLADRDEVSIPIRTGAPFTVFASGDVLFGADRTRYDMRGTVSAEFVSCRGVPFQNVKFDWKLNDSLWTVSNASADFLGGRLTGNAAFTPQYDEDAFSMTYIADIAAEDVSLEKAQNIYRTDDPSVSPGIIDCSASFSGKISGDAGENISSAAGVGRLTVRHAELFRMPVFAGFTDFMAENVPGLDFVVTQNSLDADFTVSGGILRTDYLKIEGPVFSMSGSADIDVDKNINMALKVHLMNRGTWVGSGLHYILFPVSKFFEIHAHGPMDNPVWSVPALSLGLTRRAPHTGDLKKSAEKNNGKK